MVPMFLPFNEKKKIKLILFPFAGGAGEYYQGWLNDFDDDIDVQYCQLLGRGRYMHDKAFDAIDKLIDALADNLLPLKDKHLYLFGHSMGALIAFELARYLSKHSNIAVKHLFVSGHRAPSLPYAREFLHELNDVELFCQLKKMGGVKDWLSLDDVRPFLPMIRADFKLCERYQYQNQSPLLCPISLFYGNDDTWIQTDKLSLWQKESQQPLKSHAYSGEHFYLNHEFPSIIDNINQVIAKESVCH